MKSKELSAMPDTEAEIDLLTGKQDRFGIYQLNDTAKAQELNIDRPRDFRGHSLSVSDIVVLHQNGQNTCHYVDDIGFKEVPGFLPTADIDKSKETVVTLTVAECGEFPDLGKYYEGITDVKEAVSVYLKFLSEKNQMVPSIGINVHQPGTDEMDDTQIDVISGRIADLEIIGNIPEISNNPQAIGLIEELVGSVKEIEIRGTLNPWKAAILAELKPLEKTKEQTKTEHSQRSSVRAKLEEKQNQVSQIGQSKQKNSKTVVEL